MSDVKPQQGSPSVIDAAKWCVVVVLFSVAVVGNGYFKEVAFLYRLLAVGVLMVSAVLLAATTARGKGFLVLVHDARAEVRRISWPTKQETMTTAGVVVVAVLLSALVLWAIDSLLGAVVSLLIS